MIRRCATAVKQNPSRLAWPYDVGGDSDIGDAADFLSLSPEEAAYVELKLSFRLRRMKSVTCGRAQV